MASLGPENRVLLSLPWRSASRQVQPHQGGQQTSLWCLGLAGQPGLWVEHWPGGQEAPFYGLVLSPAI